MVIDPESWSSLRSSKSVARDLHPDVVAGPVEMRHASLHTAYVVVAGLVGRMGGDAGERRARRAAFDYSRR